MALVTAPDGSHRFFVPANQAPGMDIDNLLAPRYSGGPVRPLASGMKGWQEWPLGPSHPGGYGFRLTLLEGRGGLQQEGDVHEVYGALADGDVIFDQDGIARPPFSISTMATPDPSANFLGGRLQGATFLGVPLMMVAEQAATYHLFRDDGTTSPNLTTVAGYVPPAGASLMYTMMAGQANGAPALYVGWNSGAVNSLQVLTDLNNPPTSSTVGIGAFECVGLCQTIGIDGDSIQAYTADASGGLIKVFNTNVGLGSATYSSRARLPRGGYTVGMVTLGANPEVFYVAPKNGQFFFDAVSGSGFAAPTFRGKLMAADLRAFTIYDVQTALDYVLYATASKYGIFYCNGKQHQHLTRGRDLPVDKLFDRPPNASRTRHCRGHWCRDDQIFWAENETDQAGNTLYRRWQFDPVLERVTQVCKTTDMGTTGILSVGGARLPYSETNGHLLDYANGNWYTQFQNKTSEVGWNLRHTTGAPLASGQQFQNGCTWQTPRFRLREHPGARFVVKSIKGPTVRNMRQGGDDAFMDIAITNTPTIRFRGDETSTFLDRTYEADLSWNDSWTDEIQATMTWYQGSTMTGDNPANASRWASNIAPVVIEGIFYEEPIKGIPDIDTMRRWGGAAA